ncbi:MAG TPA: response regulator, partial [Polyangiaceae bacterium]|nr:response regulator [Polyangiaceae bacterium]
MVALAKQQVLLVDDEPQILVALEDLLSSDFVVLKAQSGTDALDVMHERPNIAVVITDQRMPEMPGDELVSKINEFHHAQRILVTGYADLTAVVRAVNDGQIFAYVTKPWNEDDLRQKVLKAAEQFRLSQELASEKRLLDDLMNNSPDGIYFKDRNLKFVRANQTVADWHQITLGDLVGKRLSEFQPTVEARRVEEQEQRSLQAGEPIIDLVTQKTLGTVARWISETKAPIRGIGETPVGLIGISRDITKQLELEQQLVQAQKMEAIGKLAGGVAHDFNNLLMVMQGCGEMLKEHLPESDRNRTEVDELLRAVERASSLTKQLLTFSKKRPIKMVLLDLNAIATEATTMLRRLVPENINIELVLSPEI